MRTTRNGRRAWAHLLRLGVRAKAVVAAGVIVTSGSSAVLPAERAYESRSMFTMRRTTLRLTLVVYDHAHLSEGKLADVESTTSEIFRRAGVQLLWIEGFGYAAKRRDVLNPAREDPATLVVKLQPDSEAARYGVRSVCGGIGFASGAIIFVPRFDPKSTVSDVTRIGHVIAHEIGHVLLGPNAHAIVGIMRGTLLQQDWENAAQGTLGFTQSQSQQMRVWIDQRSLR